MLTMEKLALFGADVETGLKRCVNRESMYLRLVGTVPGHASFDKLKAALEAGDLDAAFTEAHGLKGVTGNLALTPIFDPVCELTEHLRAKEQMDYAPLLAEILAKRDALARLCE